MTHRESPRGDEGSEAIDSFSGPYDFLSNFYPLSTPVVYEGMFFPTVEHAYQAAKTLNQEERKKVRDMPTAGKAKRAGGRVTLRADWDRVKVEVMRYLLHQKFSDRQLAVKLMATGTRQLIEGNT